MAANAQPVAAAPPVAAAQNNAEVQGNLLHRKVVELRTHYLTKQKELESPWKSLVTGVSLILSVAAVIFASASLAWFPALLIGIGTMSILNGIGQAIVNGVVNQRYRNAADAIISPGFYEFANQNPRQLANAQAINETHARFVATQA